MTKILGLTGGIASGKTTVSNYFRSLEIPIVDADIVAREVMQAGKPAVIQIAEHFGPEVLLENGEINRQRLGTIIFGSEEKRQELNEIVQGLIREEITRKINELLKSKPMLIVVDIPLLYEEEYETEVDEVMVVYVEPAIQKERLLKRDTKLTEQEAINRIKSQASLLEKANKADVVIDNNGTKTETIEQVNKWLKKNFGQEIIRGN